MSKRKKSELETDNVSEVSGGAVLEDGAATVNGDVTVRGGPSAAAQNYATPRRFSQAIPLSRPALRFVSMSEAFAMKLPCFHDPR